VNFHIRKLVNSFYLVRAHELIANSHIYQQESQLFAKDGYPSYKLRKSAFFSNQVSPNTRNVKPADVQKIKSHFITTSQLFKMNREEGEGSEAWQD